MAFRIGCRDVKLGNATEPVAPLPILVAGIGSWSGNKRGAATRHFFAMRFFVVLDYSDFVARIAQQATIH
jgi:hypothetical protein